jgi:hypothetical protein
MAVSKKNYLLEMQMVCWSELSAENWKNKLSAGPFLQLSAENPADLEAMCLQPTIKTVYTVYC